MNNQGYISNQDQILEDSQLTDLCKAKDEWAQKALYDKYANKMMRTCLRYLNDEMEAEDAMIDGFMKVFTKIDSFDYRGKGSLEGWIKRIMVNESLMLLRKRKMDQVELDKIYDLSCDKATVDSQLMEETIVNLIQKLPKGYRTVFNMYVIEGYSHKEIGEKLNISENTSKSQLSKARASLSKSLKQIGAL
ncbi:sigma-70 family RNA polymerase sigma factor [Reichenbachiella carrageenanivorans]|uniref:Sigma-70 family RNA polymerase sigma factor n=1 Tax=Reichenbachiella carrageenanivorans TaxID=2979869 RepID=A0ABY6CZE8_9BACT|nr:sigma-70 family RNA polymerase sigma factor [Reichenbachiella carrageenanivorans]UXX79285.1 sigma-70 family RNA polymerase sigma factor [Reichenbachiella carrageenanivorans]